MVDLVHVMQGSCNARATMSFQSFTRADCSNDALNLEDVECRLRDGLPINRPLKTTSSFECYFAGSIATDKYSENQLWGWAPQEEHAGASVFISHQGLQKNRYALPLWRALKNSGVTSFVDERDLPAGGQSDRTMDATLRGSTLVVYVLTRNFLSSSYCMEELHWGLEQRAKFACRMPKVCLPLYIEKKSAGVYCARDSHGLPRGLVSCARCRLLPWPLYSVNARRF